MNADDTAKAPNAGAFQPPLQPAQPPASQPGQQPASGTQPVRRTGVLPTSGAAAPAAGSPAPSAAPASAMSQPATTNAGFMPASTPASGTVPQRSAFRPTTDAAVAASAGAATATAGSPTTVTPASTPAPASAAGTAPDGGGLSLTDKMKSLTTRVTDGTRDQLEKADREIATQAGSGPRKARVLLSRVDPWSVMKIGFLLSIAAGIMLIVMVHVLWNVLNGMGVFEMIQEWVLKLFTTEQELDILQFVAYSKVMSATLLIAVVDVILLTGLLTVAAFLYNTISRVVGGIYFTLTDD